MFNCEKVFKKGLHSENMIFLSLWIAKIYVFSAALLMVSSRYKVYNIVPFLQLCRKTVYEMEEHFPSGKFVIIVNSKMSFLVLKSAYRAVKLR